MHYTRCKNVMRDGSRRAAYDALAQKTFGLSFEPWYQSGFWSDSNIPYTLFDGDKAVSNVSVNRMEVLLDGQVHNFIQLGTVMTDPDYRRQGLCRQLMEEVLRDWPCRCDAIFLFANDTVLDFYPKFGFRREAQYQYTLPVENPSPAARKLNMDDPGDVAFLREYYGKTNPFSKLQVIRGFGLLMFYCGAFLKDCVYYVPEQDAVVIAEQEGTTLHCLDVYCGAGRDLRAVLSAVSQAGTTTVNLKFTPVDTLGCEAVPVLADDDALFVLAGKENPFRGRKLLFPEISHT